jgi:WD40 repeat protein
MLAWDPNGTRLASASRDRTVRVWDPTTGNSTTLEGHTNWVAAVAWDPNGTRLASASHDGTVRVWDPTTNVRIGLDAYAITWHNSVLAVAYDQHVMAYEVMAYEVTEN